MLSDNIFFKLLYDATNFNEEILRAAGVDPSLRGERLGISDFVAIAMAARA